MNPSARTGGTVRPEATRVTSGGKTAVPSGFGTVMECEHALQSSTIKSLQALNEPHAGVIERTLRNQRHRLDDIMALLKRRCELLPCPARFDVMARFHRPGAPTNQDDERSTSSPHDLPDLVAQHRGLLRRIRRLARPHQMGDRGEAMLAEMVRSHVHMIWRLTMLIRDEGVGGGRGANQ